MRYTSVFLLFLLSVAACKTSKKTQAPAELPVEWITDESAPKVMNDKEIYAAVTETIPLDSAYIRHDTLHLHTQKMTGCAAEEFKLVWNGAMMKSLPPQTNVRLFHRREPACNERHFFHLTFNIAPLRMKKETASLPSDSSSPQRSTVLRVAGWKAPVRYEY